MLDTWICLISLIRLVVYFDKKKQIIQHFFKDVYFVRFSYVCKINHLYC